MKIACEKCNKIIDAYFNDKYVSITKNGDNIVLCKSCYDKFNDWLYKDEEAAALEAVQNAGKKPAAAEYTQPAGTHDDAAEDAEEPEADTAAVQTVKKNNQPPERKSRMDKGTVLQLLKDGYSTQDIADRYGYKTTKTVDNFCKTNKINVKLYTQHSDRQLTEADIPQIRELYTDGPFNLTQTAGELGISKKQLRAFVEENHLVKPVAD